MIALIGVAACGRIGFDAAGDGVVPLGHDEDGDGLPDSIDLCPCVPGPQVDGDGDGVGDSCDPHPTVALDRIALFSTMGTGDMPFTKSGMWTQDVDGIRFEGSPTADVGGSLSMPFTAGDIRVELGVDILAIGGATFQHQVGFKATGAAPYYYGELNEQLSVYSRAEIAQYDGSTYSSAAMQSLTSGIHPGAISMVLTELVGTSTRLQLGWPGEPYDLQIDDALYQGTTQLAVTVNNLRLEIRYVCVITSS